MTDIETALAEALQAPGSTLAFFMRNKGRANAIFWEQEAARILATEPMQAIARQAAIGAAVERLDDCIYTIQHFDGEFALDILEGDLHAGEWSGPTLPEAIAAALEDDR